MRDFTIPNKSPERDEKYMAMAIDAAKQAAKRGEVPVGCVIVRGDEVLAVTSNRREELHDATYHAELAAISEASRKLGGWRLIGCELYVTLEPCPMCAGAIVNARVPRVVYATKDAKAGAFGSVMNMNCYPLNHKPAVDIGVKHDEAAAVLRDFFEERRKAKSE